MATHSSVLAWRIPGTGEPGGLPSMGSHRVGHDWSDLAAAAASFLHLQSGCKEIRNIAGQKFIHITPQWGQQQIQGKLRWEGAYDGEEQWSGMWTDISVRGTSRTEERPLAGEKGGYTVRLMASYSDSLCTGPLLGRKPICPTPGGRVEASPIQANVPLEYLNVGRRASQPLLS